MLCKRSYQSKELLLILCCGTCSIGGTIVQCLQRSCFVTALKRRRRQSCHMCCSALNGFLPLLSCNLIPLFYCSSYSLSPRSYLVCSCMCLFLVPALQQAISQDHSYNPCKPCSPSRCQSGIRFRELMK